MGLLFIFREIWKERRHSPPCGPVNISFVTLRVNGLNKSLPRAERAETLAMELIQWWGQGGAVATFPLQSTITRCTGCFSSYPTTRPSILEGVTAQCGRLAGSAHRASPALWSLTTSKATKPLKHDLLFSKLTKQPEFILLPKTLLHPGLPLPFSQRCRLSF